MDLVFLMFTNGLVLRKSTGNHRFSCFFSLKYGCSRVFLQNFLQPILSFRFFHSSLQVASLIATLLQGKLIKLGWVATCRRQIPTESCDLNCSLEGIPWDYLCPSNMCKISDGQRVQPTFLKIPSSPWWFPTLPDAKTVSLFLPKIASWWRQCFTLHPSPVEHLQLDCCKTQFFAWLGPKLLVLCDCD